MRWSPWLLVVLSLAAGTQALVQSTSTATSSASRMTLSGVTAGDFRYAGLPSAMISPGWTMLQDTFYNPGCNVNTNSCTMRVLPTTKGSVWAIQIVTGNNVTITAANGWTLCSNCHQYTGASGAQNMDAAYRIGTAAGTTSVTVTLSANATGFWGFAFVEFMPPAGSSASLDTSGSVTQTSCTVCTAVPLTLSATDAVVEFQIEQRDNGNEGWNSWSAPFFTDVVNNGIYLNAPPGSMAAPKLTQSPSGTLGFSALAFKSTAGTFNVPPPRFSIRHFVYGSYGGMSCTPNCRLTVPSTAPGSLLFVHVGALSTGVLSSVSGGGAWALPSGAHTCQLIYSAHASSCAYVLSSTAGTTSLTMTMSASGSYGIAYYELTRTPGSGSFALDTQGAKSVASSNYHNYGPTLALSGGDDVIFQQATGPNFYNSARRYVQPYVATPAGFQVFFHTGSDGSATGILLNTADGEATQWMPQVASGAGLYTAIAFR